MNFRERMLQIKQEITHPEFFVSYALKKYIVNLVEAVCKKYNSQIDVTIQYINSPTVAYATGRNLLYLNANNEFVNSGNSLREKIVLLKGLALHECGHLLFTDFHLSKNSNKVLLERRKLFPEPKCEAYKQFETEIASVSQSELQQWLAIYNHMDNCIEDGFVENMILMHVPGEGRCLMELRKIFYDKTTSFKVMKNQGLKDPDILFNCILSIAKYGTLKMDKEDKEEEVIKTLLRHYDTIMAATKTQKSYDRKRLINELFSEFFVFFKNEQKKKKKRKKNRISPMDDSMNDSAENAEKDSNTSSTEEFQDSDDSDFEDSDSEQEDIDFPGTPIKKPSKSGDSEEDGFEDQDEEDDFDNDSCQGKGSKGNSFEWDDFDDEDDFEEDDFDEDDFEEDFGNCGNKKSAKSNSSKANDFDRDSEADDSEQDDFEENGSEENPLKNKNPKKSLRIKDYNRSSSEEGDFKEECEAEIDFEPSNDTDSLSELLDNLNTKETIEDDLDVDTGSVLNDRNIDQQQNQELSMAEKMEEIEENQEQMENSKEPSEPASPESFDINRIMDEIAAQKAEQAMEKELTEQLKKDVRSICYTSVNENIPIELKRRFPSEQSKQIYEKDMEDIRFTIKKTVDEIRKKIRDRQSGGKMNGLYMGRYLDQHNLGRFDLRLLCKNNLPEDIPDMAFCLYVDTSGSMSGQIKYARQTCLILYEVAQALHIPVMVYSHNADFNDKVNLTALADFDSKDRNDRYRICDMSSDGCNRDGMGLRFCAERIAKCKEETKIVFSISDGLPSAYSSYDHAEKDIRSVLYDYSKKNVKFVSVGIGADQKRIEQLYTQDLSPAVAATFLATDNYQELPKLLVDTIKKLLTK